MRMPRWRLGTMMIAVVAIAVAMPPLIVLYDLGMQLETFYDPRYSPGDSPEFARHMREASQRGRYNLIAAGVLYPTLAFVGAGVFLRRAKQGRRSDRSI